MFVAGGLVLYWYVENEAARAAGEKGFLAIGREPQKGAEAGGPAYRPKQRRLAAQRLTGGESPLEARAEANEAVPAFKSSEDGEAYRSMDGPRYTSRGPLPRFGEKPKRPKD